MTPEETIERANRAEKLVNDPMLKEAFVTLRAKLHQNIEAAPIRDKAGVHECRLMLKIMTSVEKYLESVLRDGQIVLHRLEERKKHARALEDEKRRLAPVDYSTLYRR